MDPVRLSSRPQCRLSIVLAVFTGLLGLCGRSMSQISGLQERIGCVKENMTITCFDIYNISVPWSGAWTQCSTINNNTQLALLRTPNINQLIGKYMIRITGNLDDDFPVWIGGRELSASSWNWTNGKAFTMQNTSTVLILFSAQVNRYENCATVGTQPNETLSLVFQSSQCQVSRQFICQADLGPNSTLTTMTTCAIAGNEGIVINGSCYAIMSTESLSWFGARSRCQTIGADLAVFDETSSTDQDAILFLLPNATFLWFGLRRNPWDWVTNFDSGMSSVVGTQEISYNGWQAGIPYQRGRSCLAMNGRIGESYAWINLKCDETHQFICQQTTILRPIITVNDTTNSTWANSTSNDTSMTTPEYYDYAWGFNGSGPSSYQQNIVNIVVPVVIVAVVILVLGFTIYCYFAQRRVGYVQTQ